MKKNFDKFSMVDVLCKRFYFRRSKVVLGQLDVVLKFKPLFCDRPMLKRRHPFCEKVDDYYKLVIPGFKYTSADVVDLLESLEVEETFDLTGKSMVLVLDEKDEFFDLGEPRNIRSEYPQTNYLEDKGDKCQ